MKQSFKMILLSAVATCIFGCGEDTSKLLDYRNADIVHGVIYEKGSNTPFTGKVTNVPGDLYLSDLQANLYNVATKAIYMDGVIKNDSLDHIGSLFALAGYRSYDFACNSIFIKGVPDGVVECIDVNVKKYRLTFNAKKGTYGGKLIMTTNSSGKEVVVVDIDLKDSQANGNVKMFYTDGTPLMAVKAVNSVPAGEFYGYHANGNVGEHSFTNEMGLYDGELTYYYVSGVLGYKGNYADGQKMGEHIQLDNQSRLWVTEYLYDEVISPRKAIYQENEFVPAAELIPQIFKLENIGRSIDFIQEEFKLKPEIWTGANDYHFDGCTITAHHENEKIVALEMGASKKCNTPLASTRLNLERTYHSNCLWNCGEDVIPELYAYYPTKTTTGEKIEILQMVEFKTMPYTLSVYVKDKRLTWEEVTDLVNCNSDLYSDDRIYSMDRRGWTAYVWLDDARLAASNGFDRISNADRVWIGHNLLGRNNVNNACRFASELTPKVEIIPEEIM